MENTLQRIKRFINYKGINNSRFEKIVGFSNGAFASQLRKNKTIGVDKLENILKKFPEIDPRWLLTGKGDMIKSHQEYQENYAPIPYKSQRISEPFNTVFSQSEKENGLEVLMHKLTEIEERLNRIEINLIKNTEHLSKSGIKEITNDLSDIKLLMLKNSKD